PPSVVLCPYTTLFRSGVLLVVRGDGVAQLEAARGDRILARLPAAGVGVVVRCEAGIADAGDGQAPHFGHLVLEHDRVVVGGDGGAGGLAVVVAADEHVGHVETSDRM